MIHHNVQVTAWNPETHRREMTGEEISIYKVARCMTIENFVEFLGENLTFGENQFDKGQWIGWHLQYSPRTLQSKAIVFALGIIIELSNQKNLDARGSEFETAKTIALMVKAGKLPLGPYL